jgi:hypothetical protein
LPGRATRPPKGDAIPQGFYVQLRYPQQLRWVAVAVSENRRTAATFAANAYRHLRNDAGHDPTGVRIISTHALETEGGAAAITQATTDLWARAVLDPPRHPGPADTGAHSSTRAQPRTPSV